jgi:hypothetical protein
MLQEEQYECECFDNNCHRTFPVDEHWEHGNARRRQLPGGFDRHYILVPTCPSVQWAEAAGLVVERVEGEYVIVREAGS